MKSNVVLLYWDYSEHISRSDLKTNFHCSRRELDFQHACVEKITESITKTVREACVFVFLCLGWGKGAVGRCSAGCSLWGWVSSCAYLCLVRTIASRPHKCAVRRIGPRPHKCAPSRTIAPRPQDCTAPARLRPPRPFAPHPAHLLLPTKTYVMGKSIGLFPFLTDKKV